MKVRPRWSESWRSHNTGENAGLQGSETVERSKMEGPGGNIPVAAAAVEAVRFGGVRPQATDSLWWMEVGAGSPCQIQQKEAKDSHF